MNNRAHVPTALAAALLCLLAFALAAASAGAYERPPLHARFQYQLQPVDGHAATGGYNIDVCESPAFGGPCVRPEVWGIDLYEADGITPNRRAVSAITPAAATRCATSTQGRWRTTAPTGRNSRRGTTPTATA